MQNDRSIRDAVEADLPAIVDIYNSTIPSFIVTGDTEPVSVASRLTWFHAHTPTQHPLWVMEQDQAIAGWLGFQPFYGRCAYAATAELSIYVAQAYRRQGVGRKLLEQALRSSPSLNLKTLLGFIFGQNQPSLQLFETFGFQRWGHLPQVAQLNG
ncbi:MAG: GNAT family N-acetyltransferase, partial [Leptolyngbyaceae bacterium]|nr:GNAT family N-acetyltransferase [Leptolyngbyaceae bacterium]